MGINREITPETIYLTRGADCSFTVRRRDPTTAEPVDWDADVYVLFDVSRTETERVDADIVGSAANILIDHTLLDAVRSGFTWQVIMSRNDVETPVLVGSFERNDGKK